MAGPIKIEFHGDSTQIGVSSWGGVVHYAQVPPPKYAQMALRDVYGQANVEATNFGVGGSKAADALHGTSFYTSGNFASHIAQSDADVVVCNWAINDAFVPGHTAAAHAANYSAIKQIVEGAGKVFIAETPNPVSYQWPARNDILVAYSAAVRDIPGIILADQHAQVTWFYPLWESHMSDGVHPNNIMYIFKGQVLFNVLNGLVGQLLSHE